MANAREGRKVTRLKVPKPLRVVIGSIGSDMRYELQTSNISQTGFFLSFDKPGRFPFNPSSMIEIWLELSPDTVLFFNGKISRVVMPDDPAIRDTGPGIAIRIIQISQDNQTIINDYIQKQSTVAEEVPYVSEKTPPIAKAS